jgi:hypothetical protein
MGADLSLGCVKGRRIVCPLHGWEYGTSGLCEHIPASLRIPAFARQPNFPVEQRWGQLFFFNSARPRFALPSFANIDEADLLAARPFELIVDAPWHLVGANGFDVQHFRYAHDRTLLCDPTFDSPHPFVWRMRAAFTVTGKTFRDRLTRHFSGSEVEMTVENYGGNLVLVTAKFRRTSSYGIVSLVPLENGRTKLRDIVLIPRRKHPLARVLIDPLDVFIRRSFIREFVRSDVNRSAGIRFRADRMIGADKPLVEYLDWLHNIHHPPQPESP